MTPAPATQQSAPAAQSSPGTAANDLMYSIKAWDQAVFARDNDAALHLDDFELGRTIGKGRFARVRMVKLKADRDIPLCLKILKKKDVHRLEQVVHIVNEKDVLASSRHPFIIQLLQTFQDPLRLYMALELVNGGELFTLLRSKRQFKLPMAQFYIAEVSSALSYLHEMLVVYRDIKPENILIHRSGHLKLTDFGFAKYLKGEKTTTVCGTAAYMAPDIIRQRGGGYGLAVDWWAVGILAFELLSGRPPFDASDDEEICKLIVAGHAQYPPVMDKVARDFIMRLLVADPMRRLGSPDASVRLRDHAFFKALSWDDVDAGRLEPPWMPELASGDDTSLFERFEESTGGGGVDSCTASAFLGQGEEDPFTKWSEKHNLREEALQRGKEAQEKHQRRLENKKKALEEQERQFREHGDMMEAQKKQAAGVTVEEKPQKKQPQACCTVQ